MEIDKHTAKALELVNAGKSFFITGKAGTGKTTLLHKIVDECKNKKKHVVVLAPTGVAARNAGGMTIHSFLKIPLGPYIPGAKNRKLYSLNTAEIEVVKSVDMIIIDEVSMVRCDVMDAVDVVLRKYRGNKKPFGGVQMVMFGDLFQLMPVANFWDRIKLTKHGKYKSMYFFNSRIIEFVNCKVLELQKVYRQTNTNFVDLLNRVRDGRVVQKDIDDLEKRYVENYVPKEGEPVIRLTTHNVLAEEYNQKRLDAIRDIAYSYDATIIDNFPKDEYPTEETIVLKRCARVMFLRNDNTLGRYVNGTLGTVTSVGANSIMVRTDDGQSIWVERAIWDFYKYRFNKELNEIESFKCGSFIQFPLKLAWAITIHKSQGLTFDNVVIDAGKAFTYGQVYVALSRCRKFHGITLVSKITAKKIKTDPLVIEYMKNARRHLVEGETISSVAESKLYHNSSFEQTRWMVEEGLGLSEILNESEEQPSIVYNHVAKLVEMGVADYKKMITKEHFLNIIPYFRQYGESADRKLIKQLVPKDISYAEIELVRSELKRRKRTLNTFKPLLIKITKASLFNEIVNGYRKTLSRPINNEIVAEELGITGFSCQHNVKGEKCYLKIKPYKHIILEFEENTITLNVQTISFEQRRNKNNEYAWGVIFTFTL